MRDTLAGMSGIACERCCGLIVAKGVDRPFGYVGGHLSWPERLIFGRTGFDIGLHSVLSAQLFTIVSPSLSMMTTTNGHPIEDKLSTTDILFARSLPILQCHNVSVALFHRSTLSLVAPR